MLTSVAFFVPSIQTALLPNLSLHIKIDEIFVAEQQGQTDEKTNPKS